MKRISVCFRHGTFNLLFSITLAMFLPPSARAASVLMQHNDLARTGANTNETTLTTANVNSSTFGKLFSNGVDGQVFAQPLYVANLSISGGTHNVVFVCTESNSVYAFDADTASTTYWHVNLGTPFTSTCGDLSPVVGITGTPVIDASSGTLYVDTKLNSGPTHKLHALSLTNGAEKFGGPVTISATGFSASVEHNHGALLLLNGVVYVPFGSHCDSGSYHGYLLGYNATNLTQVSHFNVTPTGSQGALWQSGGGPAADSSGNIYVMTANGSFDGTTNYGESYVKLNGSLSVLDYATPSNWSSLNSGDTDFGSGGPVLINGYVVGMGKDGNMYVAKTSSMGHVGNFTQTFSAQSADDTVGPVVYWNGPSKQYVFALHSGSKTKSFQWTGTNFNTTALGTASFSQNDRVGAISLSANGTGNGILWEVGSDNNLRAYDAVNFPTVLWSGSVGSYEKMSAPTIANGKVYVGTTSNLGVWGLTGGGGGQVAAPAYVVAAGSYTNAQAVAISTTTSGATIRYTTDGSTPSETQGTVYSSPVEITANTTLKAIAYESGMTDSSVTSGTYTISGGASIISYQAENGTIGGGVTIDNGNTGFNGTGYANFPTTGGTLVFNNVDGGTAGGSTTLAFRYALGSGTSRSGNLIVNGSTSGITFNTNGSWTTWTLMNVTATLGAGATNIIELDSTGQDLANVDEMQVAEQNGGGGSATSISINFAGLDTNTLGASQTAGVVSLSNWNNALGTTGSGLALVDQNGASTAATLTWTSDHTSASGLTNAPANFAMMKGCINTSSNSTTTITVSGLASDPNGYVVYVYYNESTSGSRTGAYQISGTGITTTNIDGTDVSEFNGTFILGNNTGTNGNYIQFPTINATGFTIGATPVSTTDTFLRAPVNGIQIIAK